MKQGLDLAQTLSWGVVAIPAPRTAPLTAACPDPWVKAGVLLLPEISWDC